MAGWDGRPKRRCGFRSRRRWPTARTLGKRLRRSRRRAGAPCRSRPGRTACAGRRCRHRRGRRPRGAHRCPGSRDGGSGQLAKERVRTRYLLGPAAGLPECLALRASSVRAVEAGGAQRCFQTRGSGPAMDATRLVLVAKAQADVAAERSAEVAACGDRPAHLEVAARLAVRHLPEQHLVLARVRAGLVARRLESLQAGGEELGVVLDRPLGHVAIVGGAVGARGLVRPPVGQRPARAARAELGGGLVERLACQARRRRRIAITGALGGAVAGRLR